MSRLQTLIAEAMSRRWERTTLDEAKALKLSEIAKARWRAEESGVSVGGMPLYTDRHSQAVITALVVQTMTDPDYTVEFKTSAGFVTLTADTIRLAADAVRQHVEAQFAKECDLIAQVNAAQTKDEVAAIKW